MAAAANMDEHGVGVQLCEHSGLIKNTKRDCGYHRESEVLIVCVCSCAFEKLFFFFPFREESQTLNGAIKSCLLSICLPKQVEATCTHTSVKNKGETTGHFHLKCP